MKEPIELAKKEQDRIARLRRLMVLDTEPEPLFDEITKLASEVCGTPIALISLVDENRQWFKANIGLEGANETPRDLAFCAHAILGNEIMEVEDASNDPRFITNPLVTSEPNIRFYAGAPLAFSDGINIGTLCVIDREAKQLNEYQKRTLTGLAAIASKALLVRENAINALESKSRKLAAIIEDSDDAIISKSLDSIVTSWNSSAEKMFGYSSEEIIGQPITILFPQNKVDEEIFLLNKIKNNQRIKHYETERLNKNGDLVQLSVSLSPIKDAFAKIIGVSIIARDISQNKKMEQMIADDYERLRVTMDSIGDAVITTDRNGNVQYLNPIAQSLTGWNAIEAKGLPLQHVFNIMNEKTRIPCMNPVELCLLEDRIVGLANHTTLISRDGTEYGIEDSASPIRDTKGNTIGVVLVFHDVTVQREMANEISYRASHDALTGLVNREEFEFKLKQLINDNRETELQSALLYIDLDKFKVINDTCGHSSGDIVLKETANIMGALIRNTDTLARFGGDEFALILHKCGAEKAIIIANNICKSIEEFRFKFNEQSFRIGASIGLVMIDKSWTSDTSLMQAADNACYEAKSSGRNRVHLHFEDDNTLKAHRDDLQWVSRIEHALENDGFELFSQRIIPLQHQGLEHAEILVRMRDKSGSLILPGFFLPTSERFHLITSIDRLVVTKVFEWMRLNDGSLNHIETISINLSGQSLGDVTFHKFILNLIDSVLIDCNKLCFEITETAAITNISGAKKFINAMNGKGVKFSLDDFGSGISSFGYLKNLAVDYLKIDGQFISDLIENKIGQATVRCIAEVASVTGKKTVAEYVENQAVEDMLKEMGIDFIQGFHKHIPSPLDFLLETKCTYLDNK